MIEQALAALVDRLDRLTRFDLNQDSGRGNLNLRAYIASILGPRRVAHGSRTSKVVPFTDSVLLAKNQPSGQQCMYVECWVPTITGGITPDVFIRFSSDEGAGVTAVLERMGSTHTLRYSCVLLPNEQLYAQAMPQAVPLGVAPTAPTLIVSTVSF